MDLMQAYNLGMCVICIAVAEKQSTIAERWKGSTAGNEWVGSRREMRNRSLST